MLEEPTYCTYEFLGENVIKLNERKRKELYRNHIGFVFQAYHLIDEMTFMKISKLPYSIKKWGVQSVSVELPTYLRIKEDKKVTG